jgi:glycosyltransferase involved in cell wall biosynthesis
MRIVLVCDWFLRYATYQAAGLAHAGADVLLLCRDHAFEFSGDEEERRRLIGQARDAGVTVVAMTGRQWDVRAAGELIGIRRQLRRFAPDVLHAHSGADPRALALLPRVPLVLTVHDPVFHPGQPVPSFAPKRWLLAAAREAWQRRADAILLHSERLRDEIKLDPGQRCAIVPHGLETLERPLPAPAPRAVGMFGRLAPYKGLEVLAAAMPTVWADRPEVRVYIAGAGSTEFPVADERVSVRRGYVLESDIEPFFAKLSLSLLPYTHASQTGVGSQAVGFGVPVIASRIGGLPDLVLDESYLVRPGDSVDLAAAILRHIDDGDDVRERVLTDVAIPKNWDSVAGYSLELYEELARQARGAGPRGRYSTRPSRSATRI